MSFKLLAIRPLDGCNPKFLKNLEENRIYQFYNDYEFQVEKFKKNDKFDKGNYSPISKIVYKASTPYNFFDTNEMDINISAIVGKNGSGKSSLVELLYVAFYNLALKKELIKKEEKLDNGIVENDLSKLTNNCKKTHDIFSKYISDDLKIGDAENQNINDKDFINRINDFNDLNYTLERIQKSLNKNDEVEEINVELIYQTNNEIFIVKFFDGTISWVNSIIIENKECYFFGKNFRNVKKDSVEKLFYNIVVNYSLYGLNTEELGDWLKLLFHKNDGYQTPIVLNPMRTKGNFDINRETDLSKSRFLSNLIINENLLQVTSENVISKIETKIKSKLIDFLDVGIFEEYLQRFTIKIAPGHIDLLIKEVFNVPDLNYKNNKINAFVFSYLIDKVENIVNTYDVYKGKNKLVFTTDNKIDWNSFVLQIIEFYYNDDSHIVTKVKQALHFLIFNNLKDSYEDKFFKLYKDDIDYSNNPFTIDFKDDVSPTIKKRKSSIKTFWKRVKKNADSIICFLPPSIFMIDYKFTNGSYFSELSSGEKQNLYSINSILYHLINLNSAHSNKSDKKYKYLNIILDEIELYAHPEMQKKYIQLLLENIDKLKEELKKIKGLNFLFITHSPFILSDIPKQNILFLDNGKPQDYKRMNTFGANITDLLSDSFFINDGLMGDFARGKIENTIKWINLEKHKKDSKLLDPYVFNIKEFDLHKQIIELIDEPVLRMKLAEMLDELKEDNGFQKELALKEIEYLKTKYKL